MRTLIIGANGQLGRALRRLFSGRHEVIETVYRNPKEGQQTLDLGDPSSTLDMLHAINPDVVLIAGAFCHVDLCETERETCWKVNVGGPRSVAQYARDRGALVAFYSTDQVFDGRQLSYREDDAVAPFNVYAQSKADGEAVLHQLVPDRHIIIRTAWLYGPDPIRRNFVVRLVDRLAKGEKVVVPSDQWGSPTYTEDLAEATYFLVEAGHRGTFHATGPMSIDRYSLALKVCQIFNLDSRYVIPKLSSELGQPAPRPKKVVLDCQKLGRLQLNLFRSIDAGLDALYSWYSAVAAR